MEASQNSLRACVIGAGPSGLYASKFLADNGIGVTVFEKSFEILGNYKYAKDNGRNSVGKILYDPRIKFNLCTDGSNVGDNYDFYVCATGGVPKELGIRGKEHTIQAMDLIRRYFSHNTAIEPSKNSTMNLGKKVCIIGMGNVAMDLIDYIFKDSNKVRELTVISRSKLKDAAFDNHKLRDIIETDNWDIKVNSEVVDQINTNSLEDGRKTARRYKMLQNFTGSNGIKSIFKMLAYENMGCNKIKELVQYFFCKKPKLNLVFENQIHQINKDGKRLKLVSFMNSRAEEEYFDSIISSIGFIPSAPVVRTDKPIFYVGWCSGLSRGSIEDSRAEAEMLVDQIVQTYVKHD